MEGDGVANRFRKIVV